MSSEYAPRGFGMPSLRAILETPRVGGAPVFSCTLALAWRCTRALEGADCSAASLLDWISGADWKRRFQQRLESNAIDGESSNG